MTNLSTNLVAQRLIVGSLWVDQQSGSLVRAAYRPSMPMDLWPFMEREIGRNDRDKVRKFGPFTGNVREIVVENGLYEGRFWLPRVRIADAEGTAKGGRITMSIEQTFTYQNVRALAPNAVRAASVTPLPDIDPRTGACVAEVARRRTTHSSLPSARRLDRYLVGGLAASRRQAHDHDRRGRALPRAAPVQSR